MDKKENKIAVLSVYARLASSKYSRDELSFSDEKTEVYFDYDSNKDRYVCEFGALPKKYERYIEANIDNYYAFVSRVYLYSDDFGVDVGIHFYDESLPELNLNDAFNKNGRFEKESGEYKIMKVRRASIDIGKKEINIAMKCKFNDELTLKVETSAIKVYTKNNEYLGDMKHAQDKQDMLDKLVAGMPVLAKYNNMFIQDTGTSINISVARYEKK